MTSPSSPPHSYDWSFRRIVGATLILASVVFCFWLLYRFYEVVFILFIAIVIGTVIRPAMAWLHHRGLAQNAGVILVYILLLLLLIGFLLLLFPLISEQAATIAAAMPDYYQNLRAWLVNNSNQFLAEMIGIPFDFAYSNVPSINLFSSSAISPPIAIGSI